MRGQPALEPLLPQEGRAALADTIGADYSKLSGRNASLLSTITFALTITVFLYVFLFNFTPDALRYFLSIFINLGYAALFALTFSLRKPGPILAVIGLLGMMLIEAINPQGGEEEVLFAAIRHFSSLVGYTAYLMIAPLVLSIKQLRQLGIVLLFCIFVAMAQAVINPPVEVSGSLRLGSVTGGLQLMHPSAYAVSALALIAIFFAVSPKFNPRLGRTMLPMWGLLVLPLLFMIEGFGVRTVFLMLLSYFIIFFIYSTKLRVPLSAFVPVLVAAFLFLAILLIDKSFWLSITDLGSGRVGAYVQRFEIFAARTFDVQLLGSGVGSDYFYGKYEWRSGEKDSHNDYLSMLIEGGLIGMIFFAIFAIGLVFLSSDRITFSMTFMVLLSSLFSNASLFRPNLGTLFGIAALVGRSLWVIHREDNARKQAARGTPGMRFPANPAPRRSLPVKTD